MVVVGPAAYSSAAVRKSTWKVRTVHPSLAVSTTTRSSSPSPSTSAIPRMSKPGSSRTRGVSSQACALAEAVRATRASQDALASKNLINRPPGERPGSQGRGRPIHAPARLSLRRAGGVSDLLEGPVLDPVALPALEVEVPPLVLVHAEALGLHRVPEALALPALERGPADVVGVGAGAHLVVEPDHLGRRPGREVEEREVDRAAAVVARALARVGDEDALRGGRRLPEHLGHVPGPVGVVDEQAVALLGESMVRAHQRLGRRALQEGARRLVDRRLQEVVRRGVAHVEPDRRIEGGDLHEIALVEVAVFFRWRGGQRLAPQLLDWSMELDREVVRVLALKRAPDELDPGRGHAGRAPALVAVEDEPLPVIEAAVRREREDVAGDLAQPVDLDPLDQRVQRAVLLEDEEHVVVPAVL